MPQFDALVGVDVGLMVLVKGDGAARAGGWRSGARCSRGSRAVTLVAADGALVAGDADDLDDVGVLLVAAHGELHALGHDGALLVDAAAHGRLLGPGAMILGMSR